MSNSRFATLGLACLFASACTVVVQPAPNQPQPAPAATEQEADAGTVDQQPIRRPTVQPPRRRTAEPTPPARDPDADAGMIDPAPVSEPKVVAPRRIPVDSNPVSLEPESPSRPPAAREGGINLGIPRGHLPDPGECRVWVQGTPPGLQARARSCNGILETAPLGSWILYRPAQYQRQVRVRYLHATRHVITAVRAFDAETGAYLRDFALDEDDNNMGPLADDGTRPTIRSNGRPTVERGNSGIAPDHTGTAREKGTNPDNSGVAVGRPDTTSANSTGATDTSGGTQNPRGRIGVAVQRVDTTATGQTPRDKPETPVRRRADISPEEPMLGYDVPASLGIDPRYFPNPGQCRVWMPGLPFGRQTRPTSCENIGDHTPAGAWIMRRSTDQPDVMLVEFFADNTPGLVASAGWFNAATGEAVRSTSGKPQ